jgi:hypothetical protein
LADQGDLNYLRGAVGLLTFLLDHGGIVIYDPQMFLWWEPGEWRDRIFRPDGAVPWHHVAILTAEEPEDASLAWFHTRGMRKFGRPDLSVHRVPPKYRGAVIDLFERFIELQAFGGVIAEGQEIRMKRLPKGMTCRHAGDVDDQAHGTGVRYAEHPSFWAGLASHYRWLRRMGVPGAGT